MFGLVEQLAIRGQPIGVGTAVKWFDCSKIMEIAYFVNLDETFVRRSKSFGTNRQPLVVAFEYLVLAF